ncbi:MAG TPA: DUF692 domain-containing protein [Acidiferrobacterales bacterium]|nr:DUF692 domain-containing protein [Acidiferrobacterales bacterium]
MSPVVAERPHGPIPNRSGIGLRAEHYRELVERCPPLAFVEVHSENYFGAGGAPHYFLEQARARYPLSLHGVGLSLGSSDPLNLEHLRKLKTLIQRFEPALVSDHLSWSSVGGVFLNDLLPLPYTEETLAHFSSRVAQAQDYLGRELLIENPSSYLQYNESSIPEWEFLAEMARRSGCGLLLDVNNIYVSSQNHGFDAHRYLQALPAAAIREIHLAGYTVNRYPEGEMLIDSHNALVSEPVWELYAHAIRQLGPRPTLIEWDTDLPPLDTLTGQANQADAILARETAHAA